MLRQWLKRALLQWRISQYICWLIVVQTASKTDFVGIQIEIAMRINISSSQPFAFKSTFNIAIVNLRMQFRNLFSHLVIVVFHHISRTHQNIVIVSQLLNDVQQNSLFSIFYNCSFLFFIYSYSKLFQFSDKNIPIALFDGFCCLIFQVAQDRVQIEWFSILLEYGFSYGVHQFTVVIAILQSGAVDPWQLYLLFFNIDLISLIVIEITSVDHPEVIINIHFKPHCYILVK